MPARKGYIPRRLYPALNMVRPAMNVDQVHSTLSYDNIPFTGKGVTIAIVDGGIDPRHIAFSLNGTEESRIVRYTITASAAESQSGELEARSYSGPFPKSFNDVDLSCEGHGTHTAGIAGGANIGGDYTGIAPDADLFLVSMGDALYEDETQYGLRSALEYAEESGKPLVASFSLGDPVGPHLGNSPLTEMLAYYPSLGRIAVFAAGNDGMNNISITRNFAYNPKELCVGFSRMSSGTAAKGAYTEIYSADNKKFEMALTVIGAKWPYKEVWSSPYISAEDFNEEGVCTILSKSESLFPELTDYLNGDIIAAYALDDDGYSMALLADFPTIDYTSDYTLGMKLRSSEGADIMATCNPTMSYFRSYSIPGYESGNPHNSISEYCTSPHVISVGAWNARNSWTDDTGKEFTLNSDFYGKLNEVGRYSSAGSTRGTGNTLPLVLAPGTEVISSVPNSMYSTVVHRERHNGMVNAWLNMTGTSMATPAVAGVIALWLQACPTLTRDIIYEVINATAIRDTQTDNAFNGSATGKIDAYEGLKYILTNSGIDVKPTLHKLMTRAYAGQAECVIPFTTQGGRAKIYTPAGSLINSFSFTGGTFTIAPGRGIYIIKVTTAEGTATARIVIP